MKNSKTAVKQEFKDYFMSSLDKQLNTYSLIKTPAKGWIKTIREVLGMTVTQLAKRLAVAQPTALQYELNEQHKKITLSTLERCADALNCDLVYYFKPREQLQEFRKQQARKYAKKMIKQLNTYMSLEDQSVKSDQLKYELELEVKRLTDNWVNHIWNS